MPTPPENPSPMDTAPAAPRIDFDLACVHCEASLSGAPLDGNCPACSKPVGDTLELDAIDLGTATVSADVLCPRCGYNLRSLGIAAPCPECNQAVSHALHRNILGLANPDWRKRVLRGIDRLLLAGMAAPLTLLVGTAVTFSNVVAPMASMAVILSIEAALCLVFIVGIVGASARDPRSAASNKSAWPPKLACVSGILAAGLILAILGLIISSSGGSTGRRIDAYVETAMLLSLISIVICLPSLGLCLRQIARRAHEQSLITGTNAWLIIFSVIAGLVLVSLAFGWLLFPGAAFSVIFKKILTIAGIANIVLYIQAIFGLFSYRKLLLDVDHPSRPPSKP